MSDDQNPIPAPPAPAAALPGILPDTQAILLGRDLAEILQHTRATVAGLAALREQHALLQAQLAVMERQLDGMSLIVLKTGQATRPLPVEAMKVTEAQVNKSTEEFLKKQEEELDAIIQARGGDHPPTPEELAAAAAEAMK